VAHQGWEPLQAQAQGPWKQADKRGQRTPHPQLWKK
jgi:hypothetical protein